MGASTLPQVAQVFFFNFVCRGTISCLLFAALPFLADALHRVSPKCPARSSNLPCMARLRFYHPHFRSGGAGPAWYATFAFEHCPIRPDRKQVRGAVKLQRQYFEVRSYRESCDIRGCQQSPSVAQDYLQAKPSRCNSFTKKPGGYILQAKRCLPAECLLVSFALRAPNSPALLPYFLSSVHASNFPYPASLLFAALTRTPGVTNNSHFGTHLPVEQLPHLVVLCFIASRFPALLTRDPKQHTFRHRMDPSPAPDEKPIPWQRPS